MNEPASVTLWLTGDVMTGRGIDQVLPDSVDPRLFEPFVSSALDYVTIAEQANGAIPAPVGYDYVWGDALAALERAAPALRLINLETAVTTSDEAEPKGINYRMHPANLPVLTALGVHGCTLANNHVRDWGESGLRETLDVLAGAGLTCAGAGRNATEAAAAPDFAVPGGRVRLHALGAANSGIPDEWAAGEDSPGVHFLPEMTGAAGEAAIAEVTWQRRPGELTLVSLHWGGNWGYAIPEAHRAFAHRLIDEAGADLVWGHSSHHPLGIEVYRGKLILYGCGDFLNDYEGISGHEAYRPDLVLGYLPRVRLADGALAGLTLLPFRLCRFRLERASPAEAKWLAERLSREGEPLGTRLHCDDEARLVLAWG
ncbi:CapA family protein [Halomonas sp. NO4]|uniref:CapA family protein n=1 Tax=Halomonas sp. NO4 TaxID=2484813 RepID=UPI0013D8327D|nr:CapA family protein [Halomonas sp. NO4]